MLGSELLVHAPAGYSFPHFRPLRYTFCHFQAIFSSTQFKNSGGSPLSLRDTCPEFEKVSNPTPKFASGGGVDQGLLDKRSCRLNPFS